MPKIKSKISTHNKKTLNKPVIQNIQKCKRNYLLENILYIAAITCDKKNYIPRKYKRINENTFKK